MNTHRFVRAIPLLFGASLFVCSVPAFAQENAAEASPPAAPASAPSPAPSAPPADPTPVKSQFGDAHQFALSINDNALVNEADLYSAGEIQASIFVIPHLSLGLALGAQWISGGPFSSSSSSSSSSSNEVILHVGPRIGYDIPISDLVSFWPQAGVDYRRIDSTSTTTFSTGTTSSSSSSSSTGQAIGFTVVAPIVLHPTKGFFVGAGPAFYAEVQNSTSFSGTSTDNAKATSLGLMATIGGAI